VLSALARRAARKLKDIADWPARPPAASLDVLAAFRRMERQPHPPAVLVPIHNAPVPLAGCLDSLVRHTGPAGRIILIDDASTDPAVGEVLAGYAEHASIEIHRNKRNLGFTRTVNRGLELAGRCDVVLLNSDTEVTPRWLDSLRLAAYSDDRIGTATPFSNNAGAFSAPEPDQANPLPSWLQLEDYARLVARSAARSYPRVPTGSGFCMYLRRDCLDQVGTLDAEAFPRGYGEENDFCMRATRLGWSHVIDDATLIYHVRSASFGNEKLELIRKGRAILDQRYPDYSALVRDFARDRRVHRARQRIAAVLAEGPDRVEPVAPRFLTYSEGMAAPGQDPPHGGERLSLRLEAGRVTLAATTRGGAITLESATFSAEGGSDAPPPAHLEAMLANWLVSHAVEALRFPAGRPSAAWFCGFVPGCGSRLRQRCTSVFPRNDLAFATGPGFALCGPERACPPACPGPGSRGRQRGGLLRRDERRARVSSAGPRLSGSGGQASGRF
jgi:GT2 family glycosyltransferase